MDFIKMVSLPVDFSFVEEEAIVPARLVSSAGYRPQFSSLVGHHR